MDIDDLYIQCMSAELDEQTALWNTVTLHMSAIFKSCICNSQVKQEARPVESYGAKACRHQYPQYYIVLVHIQR